MCKSNAEIQQLCGCSLVEHSARITWSDCDVFNISDVFSAREMNPANMTKFYMHEIFAQGFIGKLM